MTAVLAATFGAVVGAVAAAVVRPSGAVVRGLAVVLVVAVVVLACVYLASTGPR